TKTLKIYHTGSTQIIINPGSSGRLVTQTLPVRDSVSKNVVTGQKQLAENNKTEKMAATDLLIMPNPTSGNFILNYTAIAGGKVLITITNMEGKPVYVSNNFVVKGENILHLQTMP